MSHNYLVDTSSENLEQAHRFCNEEIIELNIIVPFCAELRRRTK